MSILKDMLGRFDVPCAFGLRAQGHVPMIERMLEEGKSWEEIGTAIGWCPNTAREHWEALQQEARRG